MELTNTNRSRAYPDRLGMDVEDTKEDFSVQFWRYEKRKTGEKPVFFVIPVHSWDPAGRFVLARKSDCWVPRRERRFMSKRSCEAAESIEDAVHDNRMFAERAFYCMRMARVNGRRIQNAPRMTGALRKILQKCLRLGIALKTPLCYNIHSGQW